MLIYGFDWQCYRDQVMPAFARWLLSNDAAAVEALYAGTRLAYEETFLPTAMGAARTWSRALAFVSALPRGPHSLCEYRLLCSAEEFTALSDRYLYRHVPHLHRCSEALAAVWGAIVERYCVRSERRRQAPAEAKPQATSTRAVAALLSQPVEGESSPQAASEICFEISEPGPTESPPEGLSLGQHPNVLRLRGWLAAISPAAMALFEFLACGRRVLPFTETLAPGPQGIVSSVSVCHYIGYLTPSEVERLAQYLRTVSAPDPKAAARDYDRFRQRLAAGQEAPLIDEVLPTHSAHLLSAVRSAAEQKLGLICRQP
ncbi:hypothetical protein [Thermogemmatispora sp.]|uniref:hypothetical protein n=1 Tax=Thermogemmatispora sp. TaxID=1968838 RepID=UPI0035E3F780